LAEGQFALSAFNTALAVAMRRASGITLELRPQIDDRSRFHPLLHCPFWARS
jgi:hypothetical protein